MIVALTTALSLSYTINPSSLGLCRVASASAAISMNGGKGFGGGEATRDPAPTQIDPNDPKGKQQAIHKAESFAEYLAKREAGGASGNAAASGNVVPTATAAPAPAPTAPPLPSP